MKKVSFTLLGMIVVVLATATFLEKYYGSDFAHRYIYGAGWFTGLWIVFAFLSFAYIFSRRLQRNLPVFLLHASFLLILGGALLTSLTAQHGVMHLRMHEPVSAFITADKEQVEIPFTLTLDTFIVSCYPGTNAAADYISRFTVYSSSTASFHGQVSMNHIFSYRGIRFYQASYDSDRQGSLLSVNRDPWGIPITYAGYWMLFASMIINLVSKRGRFRKLLASPYLRKGMCVAILLSVSVGADAAGRTLSKQDADCLGQIQVLYNGRIAPLQTVAYDFTSKLTGKRSYKDYTPEQLFVGWLLFPSSWEDEPMIYVKDAALRKVMGAADEHVSLNDFFTDKHTYRLDSLPGGFSGKLSKAVMEADEKVQLLTMLHSGELFKAYPVTRDGQTVWYAPSSALPMEIDNAQWLFIRKSLGYLAEAALKNDAAQVQFFISKLKAYQQKNGGVSVLSPVRVEAERLYNRISFPVLLYRMNLTIGLLAFLLLGYGMLRGDSRSSGVRLLSRFFVFTLWCSFLLLTCCLLLRGYISHRFPMGNGYETMMMMAWCVLLTSVLFCNKFRLLLSFGMLLSGFCLLVASLGQMNPQITPLVPVLSSPLLSLHVSLIMMAYALLGFTFLNGIIGLVSGCRTPAYVRVKLQVLSELFLLPALFLLGAGIFIGAIWANVSWGRYWAWDPKEVWALISFLVYAFALHTDSLPIFRRPMFFHLYMVLAFFTLLMTYFGVNYFLGGMHSYAG